MSEYLSADWWDKHLSANFKRLRGWDADWKFVVSLVPYVRGGLGPYVWYQRGDFLVGIKQSHGYRPHFAFVYSPTSDGARSIEKEFKFEEAEEILQFIDSLVHIEHLPVNIGLEWAEPLLEGCLQLL